MLDRRQCQKNPQNNNICLPAGTSMMLYVAPLVIAVLILAVVLAVVCKVKPWKMKEPVILPRPLVSSLIFFFWLMQKENLVLWLC